MENQTKTALSIVAKAAELYVNSLDDLARQFAIPQIQAALQILDAALNPQEDETNV